MLFKLVRMIRKLGIDSAFIPDKDYKMLEDLAIKEKRVIITRDKLFFANCKKAPVYFLTKS